MPRAEHDRLQGQSHWARVSRCVAAPAPLVHPHRQSDPVDAWRAWRARASYAKAHACRQSAPAFAPKPSQVRQPRAHSHRLQRVDRVFSVPARHAQSRLRRQSVFFLLITFFNVFRNKWSFSSATCSRAIKKSFCPKNRYTYVFHMLFHQFHPKQ